MTLNDRITAARHSVGVWLNAVLLAAFPFTDQIMQAVNDYLPALGQYLPENVYKWVGLAVVLANIARAVRRSNRAAPAKEATQ